MTSATTISKKQQIQPTGCSSDPRQQVPNSGPVVAVTRLFEHRQFFRQAQQLIVSRRSAMHHLALPIKDSAVFQSHQTELIDQFQPISMISRQGAVAQTLAEQLPGRNPPSDNDPQSD